MRCPLVTITTHTLTIREGATMVARVKSTRFGCMLAASLFVLVLAGCADVSESASSQRAQPSKKSPPTQTGESHAAEDGAGGSANCKPTQPDMLGPFYEPGAPVRTSVGSGYVLSGSVLAAEECKPIPNAQIEFWLANPRGEYDDAHRATVLAGERGSYHFESNVPVSYGGRPPHIHVRVRAPGYEELVTQHYPERGQRKANFDLVLVAQ
jgi:protocatechuate 3,4-dioxygenase beta subunit